MQCTWDDAVLAHAHDLPDEVLQAVETHCSDEQYLSVLTRAALDPRFSHTILACCGDLHAHISASLRDHGSFASSLAALGRTVPFAAYLMPYATQLLEREQYSLHTSTNETEDLLYLLGLFRLLRFDSRAFRNYIYPDVLAAQLGKKTRPATYLILRILQIHLEAADHWFEQALLRYLGPDTPDSDINGVWDDRIIDYRFLSLWEGDRRERVLAALAAVQQPSGAKVRRVLPRDILHRDTALIGGLLLPRFTDGRQTNGRDVGSTFIETPTVSANLSSLARSVRSRKPLLLSGLAGSGKSLLVRQLASSLGKLDKMVTLHLNEQSDAKLLLGIYTTGDTPGSFLWKAGVLTTAVQEGRWVLIEDLDRAPNDVLGTLLPLIEKGQLFIPNRKETIYASEGFRILGTVRTSVNHRGEETKPLSHMLGIRHWQLLPVVMPPVDEYAHIAQEQHPRLAPHLPQCMAVYKRLLDARQQTVLTGQSKTGVARSLSPRDLLKWCGRVSNLLQSTATFTSDDNDAMFLEAVDCFLGALPDDDTKAELASVVAEELRIDPQRRDHLLIAREVHYEASKTTVTVGRYSLPRARQTKASQSSFSTNPHTARMLERVTAAVLNREPLLLVGETGVGKTTAVQHLATTLGKKLVPFNLSQQSEAGDLLGGFKPVNARTLVVPMQDEFSDLFSASFSTTKNRQYLELLSKQMVKNNWRGVCKLWRQAFSMVEQQRAASPPRDGEAPNKKRKVHAQQLIDFNRWDDFAVKVSNLERQIASGSDALAFTFVEGAIVKAVRNGDWVLLDEINLASPDTLESIADLLDPSQPSILLTEAGNIERVKAHAEFRVFAAMNPATDVGKKDLPPGIRSRFTELYVDSPDKDVKSLQSIVRAYLRHESQADSALPADVSNLYQKIITLAHQNKLVDGSGVKPHFSLRTLTRTLTYAKHIQQTCSIRRALYEGFQMSFLTFLDAESVQLVEPLVLKYVLSKKNVKAELRKALRKPDDGSAYVQAFERSKHWLRCGQLNLQDQSHYIITPFVAANLENLVRAASTRQFPVLIQGPTSSGKTSMIEYLAKRTGHKFTRINNHEHTDLQEYLGTYVSGSDGQLQFQEGILVNALREGHWLVLDELNLAPTDVLEALNRLLDDNRELLIPETQEVVRPHPDFMLFATQNPAGLYGGRKALSRAFRNRFLELHFDDIPIDELQEILHRRTQLPESRCKRIVQVYKELSVLRQESRLFESKSFATLRDLFRWAMRQNDTIEELAANGFMLLGERVRKWEERAALKAVINKVMSEKGPRVQIDEDALYSASSPEVQFFLTHAGDQDVVWTKAMRRLYVLVSRAISNNEPVLLVGETGCGKTTVCQMLASALRKQLHTVNAHQNTETGDLIGSQRPVRNRVAVEQYLRQLLLTSPMLEDIATNQALSTSNLLSTYDFYVASLEKSAKAQYTSTQLHIEIQNCRTRYNALFEWADGSLVQAMRDGAFFLLDEISLADDSVLERINSVLESQRTILLAEKGSLDSFVAASPGFQFFATMNPGGDYGKRELSPALRNRFTEIWVPALTDMDDVLQIVRGKLVQAAHPFAESMVAFSSWFKSRFDTSASSSVSLRDTLAWVTFINTFATQQIHAAIVHGAAMVYIDTLGANPAGLLSMNTSSLDEERLACLAELGRLMHVDAIGIYSPILQINDDETRFGIGPFNIACSRTTARPSMSFTFDPPTTRMNAMRVLRALQLAKPVMLEGSPGVGKTALVTAIADAVGMPLTRINLSDQTDMLDLFGSDAPVEGAQTGTFVWRDAPFLRAMKNGQWVLLDEMNLASQSVLEGLNACLDHRGEIFVPELGQAFSRHPDFRLFAAQNPHHQGGGRKGLPASFVNRFTVVYADSFRSKDLSLICQRSFPKVPASYLEQAITFVSKLEYEVTTNRRFGSSGGPWEFNLRDLSRWLKLAGCSDGLLRAGTPRDFVAMLFRQRFRSSSDRACVDQLLNDVFGPNIPSSDLFCSLTTQTLQVGVGILPRDSLNTKGSMSDDSATSSPMHLRTLQSVMICIQQSWPVIMSGPSASGKTRLIERLARSVGADVVALAMSADTDALDLIGGYEQFDPHRRRAHAITEITKHILRHGKADLINGQEANLLGSLRNLQGRATPDDLGKVLEALPDLIRHELSTLLSTVQLNTQEVIDKARFEWIDGPLVDALQQGKWLVLDNANLCNASVLDRLNSLLEPNGTLIVNEHTTEDGAARIIRPHPSFRIFLTVDPRLGELSRAMRNRAVELYLVQDDDGAASIDGLLTESALARMRLFKELEPGNEHAVSTTFDHLSAEDKQLVPRMIRQLQAGLYSSQLANRVNFAADDGLVETTQAVYQHISSFMQVPADSACVQVSRLALPVSVQADGKHFLQTFHPLNNQPLVQHSLHFSKSLSLAAQFDLRLRVRMLGRSLESIKSDRKLFDRHTRLIKSLRKESKSLPTSAGGPLELLERLILVLNNGIGCLDLDSVMALGDVRVFMTRLISFCCVLVAHIADVGTDAAMLIALSAVSKKILSSYSKSASSAIIALVTHFGQAIHDFIQRPDSGVGLGYVVLWQALRPSMPADMDELTARLKLEALVHDFDRTTSSFRLPIRQISDLRLAFQRILSLSTSPAEALDSLAERTAALVSQDEQEVVPKSPHFASSFELLCQHFISTHLSESTASAPEVAEFEILAGRKTIESANLRGDSINWTAHQRLSMLGLIVPNVSVDDHDTYTVYASTLQRIATVEQVSLSSLDLLEVEATTLGKAVASRADLVDADIATSLKACLKNLLYIVLRSLAREQTSSDLDLWAAHILQYMENLETATGSPVQMNGAITDGGRSDRTMRSLHAVSLYVCSPTLDKSDASRAWTSFAVACLELYIPEQAFDPVQESQVQKAVHQHALAELTESLSTLRRLRSWWVGESDSLRARLLEEDLNNLSPPPATESICRPLRSELVQVHNEFQALMRTMQPLRQDIGVLDVNAWSNILVIRKRLQEQYRAYADLTSPVVGFIDCLSIAQRLSTSQAQEQASKQIPVSSITLLIGPQLHEWLSDDHFMRARQECTSKDDQLYWLSALALRTAIIRPRSLSAELQSAIESTFTNFYDAWKIELSRDQRTTAAKSSLYQYRGEDDDSEEVSQQQLDELFPNYNESAQSDTLASEPGDAQALAPKMADLFHAVYRPAEFKAEELLSLLQQFSKRTSTQAVKGVHVPVLLCLDKLASDLSSSKVSSKRLNIYTDFDITQSKTLSALTHKVRSRFETIHQAWPDHATPIEVMRCCDQILALSYAQPVARYVPPLEKLHATVNEWQKIASSEFSASTLLEDITTLIISWRQLELSTWAGMFDHEDRACERQAASWWYVAYESIMRASEDLPNDKVALTEFSQSLVETLGDFLSNCGLGEYRTRLALLRDFEAAVATRVQEQSSHATIGAALASLTSFYSGFEAPVQDQLSVKRRDLEKGIKEVIQLASWKDRNIETLRQSAKASHRKLFRSVRKYRQLLAQPVASILQGEFPPISDASNVQLREISKAVNNINGFLQALDAESAELRKATPSTATEDNKALVQHLKTRKRRLFADVLRDVRLMGFQTNMSEEVLAQQKSLALTIAQTTPLAIRDEDQPDNELHRLLHIIPTARDSAVKHSEDLTPAEVARSKVLLESMVHTVLEQRRALAQHLDRLSIVNKAILQLEWFCQSTKVTVSTNRERELKSMVSSILAMLESTASLIDAQARLAGKEYLAATDAIVSASREIRDLHNTVSQQVELPPHISNETTLSVALRYRTIVNTLVANLEQVVEADPELGPTVRSLVDWLRASSEYQHAEPPVAQIEQALSGLEWTQRLSNIVETVDAIELDVSITATSGVNKRAWLLQEQQALLSELDHLQVGKTGLDLTGLLAQLHSVDLTEKYTMQHVLSSCQQSGPTLKTYQANAARLTHNMVSLHSTTCTMAYKLAMYFLQLTRQGFCQPSERAEDDEKQSSQVESGTGLGEGEGGEDISKDVGADEDLSELAQDAASKDRNDETEAEKDAVDMADEDLEGKFDEDAGSESGEEDGKEDGDHAKMDEETGHVDDDDGAVDEKTWDDGGKAEEAEKEAESGKGTKSEDVSAAKKDAKQEEQEMEGQEQDMEAGAEEDTELEHHQPEQADPHMDDEKNLDLPEDLNLDGDKPELSDISDVNSDLADDFENSEEEHQGPNQELDTNMDLDDDNNEESRAEDNGEATAPEHDEEGGQDQDDQHSDIAMLDNQDDRVQPERGLTEADAGHGNEDDTAAQDNGILSATEQQDNDDDANEPNVQSGTAEGANRTQQDSSSGQAEQGTEDEKTLPYKKLGDMLNEWYDQHRNIEDAKEQEDVQPQAIEQMDMNDARFEHTGDADAAMQALGAASTEQSQALDEQNAVPIEQTEPDRVPKMDQDDVDMPEAEHDVNDGTDGSKAADSTARTNKSIVGKPVEDTVFEDPDDEMLDATSDSLSDVDDQLTKTHLSHEQPNPLSLDSARQIWSTHESRTRNMAIVLTEHLRLILQPTQATKMRGDFRTGKRLNIKKIIPYIASSYKRDKIWMRRSVPSKRSYQIMLAIDDSESMNESKRKDLAFDTLALVAKSLSMLEVGELCIVGFGQTVNINHDFSMPFTSDAGAEVVRQFSFSQTKTDVRKLLERSIDLFREAKMKASGSASNLWQLQMIISDGLCEDHPSIRQLVRQAHEEQIMVVFIVVDAKQTAEGATKQSIMEQQRADFSTKDAQGQSIPKLVKYMDTFPFRYYLIVRDVQELPSVLAGALRQWFAEVVDSN